MITLRLTCASRAVPCKEGNEQYCVGDEKTGRKLVDTYNAKYHDGSIAQGGYSTAIRAHQQFVFPIPDEVSSNNAASMLCGECSGRHAQF